MPVDEQSTSVATNGTEAATRTVVDRLHVALNAHDLDAVRDILTEDCVFESTSPPVGERHVGPDAVCHAWAEIAQPHSAARFDIEELIVAGDRAIVRWHYHWGPGPHAHVRGVDILEVRDGKISESLAYVKG